MRIKPNRLVYKNTEAPPASEAAEVAEAKPEEVARLPEEVKKTHEEHRKALVDILAPNIKSGNPKIRKAALDALDKLDKLEIGFLTDATRDHFMAKFFVIVESHGEKGEEKDESYNERKKGLRAMLADYVISDNPEISTAAADALKELNGLKKEDLTEAKTREFLTRHTVVFEYHEKNAEAANIIREIMEVPKERENAFQSAFNVYHEDILKSFPDISEEEKEQIDEVHKATQEKAVQMIRNVEVQYSAPTISLEAYQENPATLTSKIATLQNTAKTYKADIKKETKRIFNELTSPTYESLFQNLAARRVRDSIEQIDKRSQSALKALKRPAMKKKIQALAKNAKAQIEMNSDPEGVQVRAAILCQFRDDVQREIEIANTGQTPEKREQPHLIALAKMYGREGTDIFEEFPVVKQEPELKKMVGKKVEFKTGKTPKVKSEAGLSIARIEPPLDENVILSSAEIYQVKYPGKEEIDYVKVKIGPPDGPEGLIPKDSIV